MSKRMNVLVILASAGMVAAAGLAVAQSGGNGSGSSAGAMPGQTRDQVVNPATSATTPTTPSSTQLPAAQRPNPAPGMDATSRSPTDTSTSSGTNNGMNNGTGASTGTYNTPTTPASTMDTRTDGSSALPARADRN